MDLHVNESATEPAAAKLDPDRGDRLSRRDALALLLAAGGGGVAASLIGLTADSAAATERLRSLLGLTPQELGWDPQRGEFVLPPLRYAYDALQPAIDAETMRLHHSVHHAGYVRGLNAALADLAAIRSGVDAVERVQALSRAAAFHGSGHVLHVLFWLALRPTAQEAGRELSDTLRARVEAEFGSVQSFRDAFIGAGVAVQGSGWAILAHEPVADRLMILSAESHQDLTVQGVRPILPCDVWEHAYYLRYRSRRADYVRAFMAVTDWEKVERRIDGAW